MTQWHFVSGGPPDRRMMYATGPGWRTDEEYMALLRESFPMQGDLIKPGGELQMRPSRTARRQVKQLLRENGFEFVGMRQSDNDRPWLIFRKKAPHP